MKKLKSLLASFIALLILPVATLANEVNFYVFDNHLGHIDITQPSSDRQFNDSITRAYYLAFGPGFDILQRNATSVNESFSVNGLTLNFIESISLQGISTIVYEGEEESFTHTTSFTIFTIEDTQNRFNGDIHEVIVDDTELLALLASLDEDDFSLEELIALDIVTYFVQFIYSNENTHYFLLEQVLTSASTSQTNSVSVTLQSLLTDLTESDEDIDFILTDILSNQGNLVSQDIQGISWELDLENIVGDVDDFFENLQTLPLSSFEVSVGSRLLTNIALVDDMLHLQFRGDFLGEAGLNEQTNVILVDSATGLVLTPLYTLLFDDFGHTLPDGQEHYMYTEAVFDISNLHIYNLVFRQMSRQFAEEIPLDVYVSAQSNVMSLNYQTLSNGSVELNGQEFLATDLMLDSLFFSFTLNPVDNVILNENDWFSFFNEIDIDFIYNNQPQVDIGGINTSFLNWFIDEYLNAHFSIYTVIDIDNLNAILINNSSFYVQ